MIVLRWAFGHADSTDSFVEVPDSDVEPVWAALGEMTGQALPLQGDPLVSEAALDAAARSRGPDWVAEHFGGLAGLDGEEWWKFLAVGCLPRRSLVHWCREPPQDR